MLADRGKEHPYPVNKIQVVGVHFRACKKFPRLALLLHIETRRPISLLRGWVRGNTTEYAAFLGKSLGIPSTHSRSRG